MKKLLTTTILLLLIGFTTIVFSGNIVYPWRSATAIVKSGETFEVWFNADAGQIVNAIVLQGPYNTVDATITATENKTWIYDQWSENTCNQKITVSVSADTPADRYNLILKTTSGDEVSLAGVKVVKEYKTNFYIFHISDAHRWQGTPDAGLKILQGVSTTVDIANIIDPEMVIETGDNHYANTNNMASTKQRVNDYMNGFMNATEFVNGMNNFSAPVFSVPGNHDTPQKNYQLEPDLKTSATYYNEYYGLQAHNFTYGNVRFIGLNNAWFSDESDGVPNFGHQTDAAKSWLNTVGNGDFRVGYCHVNTPNPLGAFHAPLAEAGAPLDLILVGHCHNSLIHSIKGYPDIKIAHSVYPLRESHRRAPFNLYKVNTITRTYEPVGNTVGAQEGLEIADNYSSVKLKLTHLNTNNGSSYDNEATIVNKYGFPIDGAKVRFVMPKGSIYYITNGVVSQEFDGTDFHIVDVSVDLEANSTTVVRIGSGIRPDLCPNDPDKIEPGQCGCGVPEGTCFVHVDGVTLAPAKVSMNLFVSRQLTTTFTPVNATDKTISWSTSDANVATVNENGLVTAVADGTATITATTQDGAKTATSEVTVIPDYLNYQAELAEFSGPIIVANQPGYKGSGFLDYSNPWSDYIKWYVYAPSAGTYTLSFRYALAAGSRPLKLTVNDEVRIPSIAFPVTGSFASWKAYTSSQALNAGTNTITLTAIGSSGGNYDELTISDGTTSITDLKSGKERKSFTVYPNPFTKGLLSIKLKGFANASNVGVSIFNLAGRAVYEELLFTSTHLELDLSGKLNESVYFISVESRDTKIVNKLIVK